MVKIAINGFGRIGTLTAGRMLEKHPSLQLAAINDLLKPNSDYTAKFFAEKDPANLPWRELGIDIVLECSGFFTEIDGAKKHLTAGAKKVIISAPASASPHLCNSSELRATAGKPADSDEIPTYLLGVNEEKYNPRKDSIISMGSCTTNAVAPVVKILDERFGIKTGFVNTVHSYTNSQNKLYPNWRTDAASKLSIIPSTTGATKTVEKCLPNLKGKLNGLSLRVPTETVSIVEIVFLAKKKATVEKVNQALQEAAETERLKNILKFENKKLISSDLKASPYSGIIDAALTQTFGKLIKVLVWYDNEYGYACRLAEMADFIANKN